MNIKNLALAFTACAMAIAPVAAQAGTTASASASKLAVAMNSNARQSSVIAKKNRNEGNKGILTHVVAAGVGVGVGCIIWCGGKNKSNGS